MQAFWNTKEQGSLRFLVYKDGDEFCGVCLEFNLIEYGDNPDELLESLKEGAESLIKGVAEHNLSEEALNDPADIKYWLMFEQGCSPKSKGISELFHTILAKQYVHPAFKS